MKKAVVSPPIPESSLPSVTERVLLCGVCAVLSVLSAFLLFGSAGPDETLMLSLLACGLGMVAVVRAARSVGGAIGFFIFIAAGFLLLGLYALTGIAASFAAAVAVTAVFWAVKPSPWFFLLPLISGGLSFALLRNLYAAVFALLPFALALLLGDHLRRRRARASGVCRMTLVLVIPLVLLFFLHVWITAGYVNTALLRQIFDALRERVSDLLAQNILSLAVPEADAALVTSVLDGIPAMTELIFNYLPALLVIGAMGLTYWIYGLCVRILFTAKASKHDVAEWLRMDLSPFAAVAFLLALVGSAAFRFDGEIFAATVCQNLFLILIPGMLWAALDALRGLVMTRMQSCLGTLLYFGSFLLLFLYPSYTILIGSLAGAALLLLHHLIRKLNQGEPPRG